MGTPLLDRLTSFVQQDYTGFHTPGHCQGRSFRKQTRALLEQDIIRMDLTELPGLDNLTDPKGCILEAQVLAARVFDSCRTFFLVNGSTVGLQASLLARVAPGQEVIITRQAHVSLLNGLVLTGGRPIIAPTEIDSEWGIPLGTKRDTLAKLSGNHPGAQVLVITQPSYQGVGVDMRDIISLAEERGLTLIADEAHGAHLYFQSVLPLSAQKAKADITVQSTHKTLGAFTQASMLHVNREKLVKPVQRALEVLHTSSPSYLLMLSLDIVQEQMGVEGAGLVADLMEMAEYLRSAIRKMKEYRLFGGEPDGHFFFDPAKVAVSSAGLGLTGWDFARILHEKYGILVEQSDYYYVLFMLTAGTCREDVRKLAAALDDLRRSYGGNTPIPAKSDLCLYQDIPSLVYTPREAFFMPQEERPLEVCLGRVAAAPLVVYPPGIPLVWPGQRLDRVHMEYLAWAGGNNLPVKGITEEGKMRVIREE